MSTRVNHHKNFYEIHKFFLITAIVVAILSLLGIALVFFQISQAATSILLSLGISEPSAVTSAETPVAVLSGGPISRLTYLLPNIPAAEASVAPKAAEPEIISSPAISLELFSENGEKIENGEANIDSPQAIISQFSSTRPIFKGNAGIANALIFLELHSDPAGIITASIYADHEGNWSWQPSRDINQGSHTLYLTVFDQKGEVKLGAIDFQFIVLSPEAIQAKEIIPRKNVSLSPSLVDARQILFDISVDIVGLDEPNEVRPGDELLVKVNFLNIGTPGKLVDAQVRYRLINDETKKIIFEQSETVGVSTQASVIKSFSTKASLAHGRYRIEASVVYGDTEATAYDQFKVTGAPVLPISNIAKINASVIIQVLALILFVALLIVYFEYKQVESLGKAIHQVTESDLKKEGLIS